MAMAAAAVGAVLLSGCGGVGGSSSTPAGSTAPPARSSVSRTHTKTERAAHASAPSVTSTPTQTTTFLPAPAAPRPRRPPGPAPGTLPQTAQVPSAATRAFRAEMAALWRGVEAGSAGPAMPAFFPEAAYVQLKTIGDPQGDWQDRLVGDYQLDLAAAHALLGGAQAQLVGVQVPSGYAHWVPPGVCDNGVGYYEVPNSRVLYRSGGELRSFGIASMISWRGVWYVVHLGAILRSSDAGVVDAPSAGAGTALPSSTC